LDGELAKCEDLSTINKSINRLFPKEQKALSTLKQTGVGQTTILKFLGGNWKQWIIQDALNTIKEVKQKTESREAVNELPSAEHSIF